MIRNGDGPRKPSGVQAIARAGRVLRALEGAPGGLSLGQLTLAVALPKSTVHRLVHALTAEGLVAAAPNGDVRLGPGLEPLAAAARNALADDVRPALSWLQRELDETADLAVLDGAGVRFVDQIPAPHRLRAVSAVGAVFPLHCTANGKALLSTMADEEVAAMLPSRLERLTAHTIVSRSSLLRELEAARRDGVAFDREEHTDGICAVSAVVMGRDGPAAAISVPVPTQRFAGRKGHYAETVREGAARASRLLAPKDGQPAPPREVTPPPSAA